MIPLPGLILASASAARAALLRGAGLSFEIIPAQVDERGLEASWAALSLDPSPLRERERSASAREGRGEALALALAEAKALNVSARHPGRLVIGADQILSFEGKVFHKSKTSAEALDKLRLLSGRTHRLVSGAAVARDGEILWSAADHADMSMRVLDEEFLSLYKEAAGDALVTCAGGYALEGAGAWLFEKVEGDHSVVLGLPLLPLLGFLYSLSS